VNWTGNKVEGLLVILDQNPQAALLVNEWEETALHLEAKAMVHASRPRSEVVRLLMAACPQVAEVWDQHRNTALHVAPRLGMLEVIDIVEEINPLALSMMDRDGQTVSALRERYMHELSRLIQIWSAPPSELEEVQQGVSELHLQGEQTEQTTTGLWPGSVEAEQGDQGTYAFESFPHTIGIDWDYDQNPDQMW